MNSTLRPPTGTLTRSFDAPAGTQVLVDGAFARVALRPSVDDRIHVLVRARPDDAPLPEALELFQERRTVHLMLTPPPFTLPGDFAPQPPLEATLHLPPGLRVTVHGAGTEILAEDVEGTFDLTACGGALRCRQLQGDLVVNGRHCPVVLKDVSGHNVTLHVTAGGLDAEGLKTRHLVLRSTGGYATLRGVKGLVEAHLAHSTCELHGLTGSLRAHAFTSELALHCREAIHVGLYAAASSVALHLDPSLSTVLELHGDDLRLDPKLGLRGTHEEARYDGRLGEEGPLMQAFLSRSTCRVMPL